MQNMLEEEEIMANGIELSKLVKTIAEVEPIREEFGNYLTNKEAPQELNLAQEPKIGERKVLKTWTLEVVFDLYNGKASNVAVLGRMNFRREKVAESVAKDAEIKYSNPVFYRDKTDSLRQVKMNARDIKVASADYDERVMYISEQDSTRSR